jgi:hypothetical protein
VLACPGLSEDDMTNQRDSTPISQADFMQLLSRQTEAGAALVTAGLVEDWLEKLLLTAGRRLSNKTAKGIFMGLGPLSSFSAKIEIAYMFELIDKGVRDDPRIVKTIRNRFAHTTRFVHFESEHIAKECRKLSNWKDGANSQGIFQDRALECINGLRSRMDILMYAKALKDEPSVNIDDDEE